MKADIVTIFPDFFRGPLDYGITRRAQEMGLAEIQVHDLRAFTHDRHRTVDDRPFGGGEGMVLKPEPLFECLDSLGLAPREERVAERVKQSVVLLSAQGQRFTQKVAAELALLDRIVLGLRAVRRCGRARGRLSRRPRAFHRRLCSERRRNGRGRDCGSGDAVASGSSRKRSVNPAGIVHG
jgi:tRNA (guanine-N1)-methyltransferase